MHEDSDHIVASDTDADANDPEQGHQEPQERILSSKHEVIDVEIDRLLRRSCQEAEPATCQGSLGRLRKRHGEKGQRYKDERQRCAKANVHAFGKGHEDAYKQVSTPRNSCMPNAGEHTSHIVDLELLSNYD